MTGDAAVVLARLERDDVYQRVKISQGVSGVVVPTQLTWRGRQELPIFHGSSYCLSERRNGEKKKQNVADRVRFCDKITKATKKAPDMEGRPINPAGTHAPKVVKHRKTN